jgi:glycosyltransferase involved in cell wall biosynthesis
MKLAHLTSVHTRFDTRILLKECCSLAEAGHDVSLLVADGNGNETWDGVQIYDVGKCSSRLGRILPGTYRLGKKAGELHPDVYHLHDPELLPLGLIWRLCGRNVVYDMHENFPEQLKNKQWIPSFIRYFLSLIIMVVERGILRHLHVIFAEKSYIKSYSWIRNKEVIQNFPILSKLKGLATTSPKRKTFTVGYLGDVTFDRGIPIVAEAIFHVRQQGIAMEFLCIGAVHEDVLNNASFQKGVSQGWLHATGRLEPGTAWPLIAGCHVGSVVLRPMGNYVESYPTKMFEYMAMCLPVLASDFLLYRQIVDGHACGLCVDPENVGDIAGALLFFYHHVDQSREMGRRGYHAVLKTFNWEAEKEKLIQFYKRLTKNAR